MTIYLSRLSLDPASRRTRSELQRPYEIHRTLAHAFPNQQEARVLFRAETDDPAQPLLLVQSITLPDWESAREHLPHVKEFRTTTVRMAWLQPGLHCRFRLLCRPTKRLPGRQALRTDGKPKDGPRVALQEKEELFAWLRRQGTKHGFAVLEVGFDRAYWLDSRGAVQDAKQGVDKAHTVVPKPMRITREPLLGAVRFDGVLEVTDAEKLKQAIASGIGSQKAFGFGLLSVAPVR